MADFVKILDGMSDTTALVLTYALTYIGQPDDRDLIGRHWVERRDDVVVVHLDFLAIRIVKYYWEIAHSEIQYDGVHADYGIMRIVRDLDSAPVPWLSTLSSTKMKRFRKRMVPVMHNILKGMSKHDWYKLDAENDVLVIDMLMADYLVENADKMRGEIGQKIRTRLEQMNSGKTHPDVRVQRDSPFYQYIGGCKTSLFIVNIEESEMDYYHSTINRPINLTNKFPTFVWGVVPTEGNKKVWEKMRNGDFVIFVRDGICFSMAVTRYILDDSRTARNLWGDDSGKNLLIVVDCVRPFHFDLNNSSAMLINPDMPGEYHFPIIRASDRLVTSLADAYGSIGAALDVIGTDESIRSRENEIILTEGERMRRIGQVEFRKMVLENYHNSCAACGLSETPLLEASHIIPVGNHDTSGRMDNGICLCVLHHMMFDSGYMYFDDDYTVRLDSRSLGSKRLSGSLGEVACIGKCDIPPNKSYLRVHRVMHGFE